MNIDKCLQEFDEKFIPKYPSSGLEPIVGLTANIMNVKSFLRSALEEQERELRAKFDNMTQEDFDRELDEYVTGKLEEQAEHHKKKLILARLEELELYGCDCDVTFDVKLRIAQLKEQL